MEERFFDFGVVCIVVAFVMVACGLRIKYLDKDN